MRLGVLLLAASLSLACDPENEPAVEAPAAAAEASSATAPAEAAAPTGKAGAPGEASAATGTPAATGGAAASDALARVKALPPVDTKEHPGIEDARDLNRAALAKHKQKNYEGSAEGFIAAVTKDPGHVVARYNLGCALAMQGEADAAFEVLDQLEKAGCPQCVGQVLVADRDGDWDKLRNDPRLRKVVSRARKRLPETKEAADAIASWFDDFEGEAPFSIDPRRSIKLEFTRYLGEKSEEEKSKLTGPKRLQRWVTKKAKEAMNGFSHDGQEAVCRGECCAFESREGISHHTLYLSEICFKMEGSQPVYAKSMKFFED